MSKKQTNDYLQFIADCSKKSGKKYQSQLKKGSDCNDEYKRLHKKAEDIIEEEIKQVKKPVSKKSSKKLPSKKPVSKKLPSEKPVIKKSVSWAEDDESYLDDDIEEYIQETGLKPKYKIVVKPKKKPKKPRKENKKPSEWMQYVKQCKLERGISHKEAMKLCSKSYKSQKGKSELSKRPLPKIPQSPPEIRITPPEEEEYSIPEIRITPPEEELKIPIISITPPEEEIILYLEPDEEIYRQNPDIQFGEGLYRGNSLSLHKKYPNIQDVNIYGKPHHYNYYNVPLKLNNPYKVKNN